MDSGPAKMFLTEPDYSVAPVLPTEGTQSGPGPAVHNLKWKKTNKKNSISSVVDWDFDQIFFFSRDPTLVLSISLVCSMAAIISLLLAMMFSFFSAAFMCISTYCFLVLQWVVDCIDFYRNHQGLLQEDRNGWTGQIWTKASTRLFSCPGFVIIPPLHPLHLVQVTLNLQCDYIRVLIKVSMDSRWLSKRVNSRWDCARRLSRQL